jgi:hypothetical protein
MKKKLTVLFLCSVIAGAGLGLQKVNSSKPVPHKEAAKTQSPGQAEETALSRLTDEDLMRESS